MDILQHNNLQYNTPHLSRDNEDRLLYNLSQDKRVIAALLLHHLHPHHRDKEDMVIGRRIVRSFHIVQE